MNILFVCSGNVNRSPSAETIMRSIAPKNIHVDSAALTDIRVGEITVKPMRGALEKKGFKYHKIISKLIKPKHFKWADYIVYMTPKHRVMLESKFGNSDKYLNMARFVHKNEIKDLEENHYEINPKYFENTVKDLYYANINLLKYVKNKKNLQ